jgi:hypothetical protein
VKNLVLIKHITDNQASECMKKGEFGPEICKSKSFVVIILTQSWCPQWSGVEKMISALKDNSIDAWVYIYDKSPLFDPFMHFKESVLGNENIPYLRYYKNGMLIHQSNAVDEDQFIYFLKG